MTAHEQDGRSRRFAHRRPEILAAVVAHVLEHGASPSLRDAAAAAGISHATLLHHFGSREALLAEAIATARAQGRTGGPPAGLADALEHEWRFWSDPGHTRLFALQFEIYTAALRQDASSALMSALTTGPLDDLTAAARDAGCPPAVARTLATSTLAEFRGLLLDLVSTNDAPRIQAAVDALAVRLRDIERSWSRRA